MGNSPRASKPSSREEPDQKFAGDPVAAHASGGSAAPAAADMQRPAAGEVHAPKRQQQAAEQLREPKEHERQSSPNEADLAQQNSPQGLTSLQQRSSPDLASLQQHFGSAVAAEAAVRLATQPRPRRSGSGGKTRGTLRSQATQAASGTLSLAASAAEPQQPGHRDDMPSGATAPTAAAAEADESLQGGPRCSVCGTRETPLWRPIAGVLHCNACGVRAKRAAGFHATPVGSRRGTLAAQGLGPQPWPKAGASAAAPEPHSGSRKRKLLTELRQPAASTTGSGSGSSDGSGGDGDGSAGGGSGGGSSSGRIQSPGSSGLPRPCAASGGGGGGSDQLAALAAAAEGAG